MDSARHVIKRVWNPRFLTHMASYLRSSDGRGKREMELLELVDGRPYKYTVRQH